MRAMRAARFFLKALLCHFRAITLLAFIAVQSYMGPGGGGGGSRLTPFGPAFFTPRLLHALLDPRLACK